MIFFEIETIEKHRNIFFMNFIVKNVLILFSKPCPLSLLSTRTSPKAKNLEFPRWNRQFIFSYLFQFLGNIKKASSSKHHALCEYFFWKILISCCFVCIFCSFFHERKMRIFLFYSKFQMFETLVNSPNKPPPPPHKSN